MLLPEFGSQLRVVINGVVLAGAEEQFSRVAEILVVLEGPGQVPDFLRACLFAAKDVIRGRDLRIVGNHTEASV